jgi:FHA domain-containing protein
MSDPACPICDEPYQPGDLLCLNCGANLARVAPSRRSTTHEDQRSQQPPPPPPRYAPPPPQQQQPEPQQQQPWNPQEPWQQEAPQQRANPPQQSWAPEQHQENWGPPQHDWPAPQRQPDHPLPPPPQQGRPPVPPPHGREATLLPPDDRRRPPDDSTAAMCPHCESVLRNPAAPQCETCLRPLRQQAPVLRVQFPSGELKISVGEHLVIGRDAGQSSVAATFAQYDNVSRRHSTVWLDPSGTAWVRDEGSTNGTFVNGERLPRGVEAPLRDGDQLRLAADVTGTVQLN